VSEAGEHYSCTIVIAVLKVFYHCDHSVKGVMLPVPLWSQC